MVSYGCPNCHGALYVESFKEEGKRFIEIICINCARLWTPQQLPALAKAHDMCCLPAFVKRRMRKLSLLVEREVPAYLRNAAKKEETEKEE